MLPISDCKGAKEMDRNFKDRTKWLCVCGVLMAMNVVLSSSLFSVPVPGGHLYLNDIIICTASILLDPVGAFLVGGVGAFLGDLLFYPAPMFVSPCARFLRGRGRGRSDYGRGLFAWPRVHLQHARVCAAETALSDFAGRCGRRVRRAAVLEVRREKGVR